jgi:hypothetical protein
MRNAYFVLRQWNVDECGQEITLDAYGWHDVLVPTDPDDSVFPYPRPNFDAVTGSVPRACRAVFIQNS